MRSTMQRQLTRRPITPDDQRIVAAAAAELQSLDARTVSDFEAVVAQVLSTYAITERTGSWLSATADLNGTLIGLELERPALEYEPDGWKRVEQGLAATLTALTERVFEMQLRLPRPGGQVNR